MLIGGTSRSTNPIWRRKNRNYLSPLLSFCGSHHISSSRAHSNKISTAIPMFSRSSCLQMLSTMSPEVVLYRKYIWRPPKPEVILSQHTGQLETKFQRLHLYFRGPAELKVKSIILKKMLMFRDSNQEQIFNEEELETVIQFVCLE